MSTRYRVWLGLDPGKTGGLAALVRRPDGVVRPEVWNMPPTDGQVWEWLSQWGVESIEMTAVLERISPGFKGTHKVSMAKLYGHYCMLRALITVAGIQKIEVMATTWHRKVGVQARLKSETKNVWKSRIKGLARETYPGVNLTLATCDALLLAHYGRLVLP